MTSNNDIVISGISGRLPDCENVEEFWKALFDGVNLATVDDRRYPPGFDETPERLGKIPHPEHFDASFFGIPPKSANIIDPRHRVFLEVAYECIVDAGYNPKELRGSNTGVYVGITYNDEDEEIKKMKTDGYLGVVLSLGICANRTSYVFDFKGPSLACDTTCSSSFYALSQAMSDMKSGKVDYALVGTTQILFSAHLTSDFAKLQTLSPDGIERPYSVNRNGFVRSDAVVAVFLQNIQDCRRVYSSVIAAQTNCDGYKKEGMLHPSYESHRNLIEKVFRENSLDPNDVTYFEGHGTGTKVGDMVECRALSEFFGKHKKETLLLGSVKSNMGHSEISAGLCSLLKVLAAIRVGIIPKNINCDPIDNTLYGIKDGIIIVVTENTPFKPGLVGMSSLGLGGANAHVVVKPQPIRMNENLQMKKQRLVLVSGRTSEAVDYFIDEILKNQTDQEFLALLDEIHKMNIDGHTHRGYVVLEDRPVYQRDVFINSKQIWFVYTGMGCQWKAMGRDLLEMEVFKETFDRCALALKPYGINLYHVVTSDDDKIFDDVTNCFVAITAIQVALTDVLHHIGIYPDKIAGHSLGEVACAYADGHFTPEQAVLTAYARGYGCLRVKDKLIRGLMAAIRLSKEDVLRILPEGIYIACQNSSSSLTVSGPEDITRAFVKEVQSKGIFAKEVKTGNIAFHSKYVHEAGKYVLEFLRDVITEPQLRSSKWISTSVSAEQATEDWSIRNSAEYHYNNFCGPVLFDQIYEQIPKDAFVVEVSPHGLMQGILKRALPETVQCIGLLHRDTKDSQQLFLSNIGRLYLAGCQPQLRKFYPEVSFPVSDKTKSISSLIKWDHSLSWFVPSVKSKESFGEFIVVDINDSKWSYLQGHDVGGRVVMPATGYVVLVWQAFAKLLLKSIQKCPIKMERLSFKRATVLLPDQQTKFFINILRKTGSFEVYESGSLVTTGNIKLLENDESDFENDKDKLEELLLTGDDFYKAFKLRNYNYKDIFKGLIQYDMRNFTGYIKWFGKFDCFLDNMLQVQAANYFGVNKHMFLPTFIEKLKIDPKSFLELASKQTSCSKQEIHQLQKELKGLIISKTYLNARLKEMWLK